MSRLLLAVAGALLANAVTAEAEILSDKDAARSAVNPIEPIIKLPIENESNFGYGPDKGLQNELKFKPVVPFDLPGQWDLVTRSIVPVIWDPPTGSDGDRSFGLGDLQSTFWLTPSHFGRLRWGLGPMFQMPTSSSESLGKGKWAAGPSFVVVDKGDPWGWGLLVWNLWSFAGDPAREPYQEMTIQPQLHYFFDEGWYLTTSPIISADWQAQSGDRWTLPVGGGLGRAFHLGGRPLSIDATLYDNVIAPEKGPDWEFKVEVHLMFPEWGPGNR